MVSPPAAGLFSSGGVCLAGAKSVDLLVGGAGVELKRVAVDAGGLVVFGGANEGDAVAGGLAGFEGANGDVDDVPHEIPEVAGVGEVNADVAIGANREGAPCDLGVAPSLGANENELA